MTCNTAITASSHIMDLLPIPVLVLDRNGVILDVNAVWTRFLGYEKQEATGKSLSTFLRNHNGADSASVMKQLLHSPGHDEIQLHLKTKDGAILVAACRANTACDPDTGRPMVYCTLREVPDRQGLEAALVEANARLQALSGILPDMVYFKDIHGYNRVVNHVFEKFLGMDHRDIEGKTDYELFPEDLADYCKSSDDSILSTGEPLELQESMSGDNGETIFFKTVKAPVLDNRGNIIGIVGTSRDVTVDINAKKTLEREKEIFLSGPVVVFVWQNQEGWPVEFVSQNSSQVLGYTAGEFMNHEILYEKIIFENDLERVAGEVEKYSASGVRHFKHEPYRLITKSGDLLWVEDYTTVKRDAGGHITHFIGYIIDVTAYKETNAALRESQERYRAILDTTDDYVYICGKDKNIEFLNRAMTKKIGRDATGEKCYRAIHGLNKKCDWCMHEEVLKLKSYQHKMVSPGDGRDYVVSSSPVFHADGSVSKMSIYRDVTEMQNAIEKLMALSHLILNAQEKERERVARELHDSIGQKIVALQIQTGVLMRGISNPDKKKDFRYILELAESAADELGIICKGLRPSILDKMGLVAAIREHISDINRIHDMHIQFENVNIEDEPLAPELAINVFRIVQEAINNALRHGYANQVTVRLARNTGNMVLRIEDNGCGFNPDVLDSEKSMGIPGMKERAMLCNGELAVTSTPGKGTVITLIIQNPEEGS